jgi:hypothetical protein
MEKVPARTASMFSIIGSQDYTKVYTMVRLPIRHDPAREFPSSPIWASTSVAATPGCIRLLTVATGETLEVGPEWHRRSRTIPNLAYFVLP